MWCKPSEVYPRSKMDPKYKMDPFATIAFATKIPISDFGISPGSNSDFYFQYKKHSTFNDNRQCVISASKSFTATFMKWEILKDDTGFIYNRCFKFEQLIFRGKSHAGHYVRQR